MNKIRSLIWVTTLFRGQSYLLIGVKPTPASVHSEAEFNTMVASFVVSCIFYLCV